MSPDWIIGALAFVTIGLVIALSIYHFGTFLKDPQNRGHAHNALVAGGESATSKTRKEGPDHAQGRTIKERLESSSASMHPDDPEVKGSR